MRWAPDRIPFGLQVVGAAVMSILFILWVQQEWGGTWATVVFTDLASTVVPLGAAVACFLRARRGDASLRVAWNLLGSAASAWALGQAAWTAIEFRTGSPPSTPSLADAGYLAFIPLAAWGAARFGRSDGHATGHLRPLLDGAIVGASFIFIAFVFGLERILLDSAQADAALIVNLLYPFGDALVLGMALLGLSGAPRPARPAVGMLAAGLVALAVADLWFLVVDAEGTYSTGGILDAFWILGFQLVGLAAMRPINLEAALPPPKHTVSLALLPLYPFALAAISACYAEVRDGHFSNTLFWTALVVILLVVARLMVMLLDNVRLTAKVEVAVQALTAEKAVRVRMMNAITHDMLNAMSPIRLQLHMMQNRMLGDFTEKQAEGIAMVQRNAEQMARLASDIKEGSNVEEGRLALQAQPMDLVATVQEAVASRGPEAEHRGVAVTVETPSTMACTGDPGRITQVVDNLLSNALKFTQRGGRITIQVATDGDGAKVAVTDSGRGLIADEAARLFQPYSQVHDPNEIKERGTGLGLFISRGIVEGHGGRIWVDSAGHGRGSTFAFWIPKALPATAPPPAFATDAPQDAAAGTSA